MVFWARDDNGNCINADTTPYSQKIATEKKFKCWGCPENVLFVKSSLRNAAHFRHFPESTCNYNEIYNKEKKTYINLFHQHWVSKYHSDFKYKYIFIQTYWVTPHISIPIIKIYIKNEIIKKDYIKKQDIDPRHNIYILSCDYKQPDDQLIKREIKKITKYRDNYWITFNNKVEISHFNSKKSTVFLDISTSIWSFLFKINLDCHDTDYGYQVEIIEYEEFIKPYLPFFLPKANDSRNKLFSFETFLIELKQNFIDNDSILEQQAQKTAQLEAKEKAKNDAIREHNQEENEKRAKEAAQLAAQNKEENEKKAKEAAQLVAQKKEENEKRAKEAAQLVAQKKEENEKKKKIAKALIKKFKGEKVRFTIDEYLSASKK
jgi:hypothetical protein